MAQIIKEFMEYCGLYYQPETFSDLITWFVMMLCTFSLLFGVIKAMFSTVSQIRRIS